MDYTVVISGSLDGLEEKVNDLLDLGYVPVGGVSVGPDGVKYQAMMKTPVNNV